MVTKTTSAAAATWSASTFAALFRNFVVFVEGVCEAAPALEGEGLFAILVLGLLGLRFQGRWVNLGWILDVGLLSLSFLAYLWLWRL